MKCFGGCCEDVLNLGLFKLTDQVCTEYGKCRNMSVIIKKVSPVSFEKY
jgi:hypothetical protein